MRGKGRRASEWTEELWELISYSREFLNVEMLQKQQQQRPFALVSSVTFAAVVFPHFKVCECYLELCFWWIWRDNFFFSLFYSWNCFSFLFLFFCLLFFLSHNHTKLRMEYLTDPALIMPILVVTFHFLTAAGFWIYFRRQTSNFENGKLFSVINRRLCPIPFICSHDDDRSCRTGFMYFLPKLRLLLIRFGTVSPLLACCCLKLLT